MKARNPHIHLLNPRGINAKGFLCPGLKAIRNKSFLHFILTRSNFSFLEAFWEGDCLYSRLINWYKRILVWKGSKN